MCVCVCVGKKKKEREKDEVRRVKIERYSSSSSFLLCTLASLAYHHSRSRFYSIQRSSTHTHTQLLTSAQRENIELGHVPNSVDEERERERAEERERGKRGWNVCVVYICVCF